MVGEVWEFSNFRASCRIVRPPNRSDAQPTPWDPLQFGRWRCNRLARRSHGSRGRKL